MQCGSVISVHRGIIVVRYDRNKRSVEVSLVSTAG